MKTKRLIYTLNGAIPALLAVACRNDPDRNDPDRIDTNTENSTLSATGGERIFSVRTNIADWSVTGETDWLTVGKKNGDTVMLGAEINTGAERTATVICIAGAASATVNVLQERLNQRQSLALLVLFDAVSALPMERWSGVTVSGNRVTRLNLSNRNLSGTIPESLGALSKLMANAS